VPCQPAFARRAGGCSFTQTANASAMRLAAKLGFTEAERFHAWDAEQWFGVRPPRRRPGQRE